MITTCILLELNRENMTVRRSTYMLILATDMDAQVKVRDQLRVLLTDLVKKQTNTNTCNKLSTSLWQVGSLSSFF